MNGEIRVYGSEYCGDTKRTRAHLEQRGLPYQWIDIDRDEKAEQHVLGCNDGKRLMPTVEIIVEGNLVNRVAEPENDELDHLLRSAHLDTESNATTRHSGESSGGRDDKAA